MKKIFILLLILLTACSTNDHTELDTTDNREEKNNINLLDEYLKDNHYSFNSKETEALKALKVYKDDFNNSSVILLGENHNVDKNHELGLYFIKYIIKEYGEVVYIGEFGYSLGLQFNEYLKTGNIEILNDIFLKTKGTAAYNKEHYNFWIELYNYINTLDNKNVIEIVGLDIEHTMRGSVEYLQDLLTDKLTLEELEYFKFIYKINNYTDEINYKNSEFHKLFDNVINDYRSYLELSSSDEYKSILGDHYFDVNMIINGLVDAYDAYYLERDGLSFAEFSTVREEAIYQNFSKVYDKYKDKLYFGQWGAPHTDLYCNDPIGFGNAASMATRINKESKVSGKIYTINILYDDLHLRDRYDHKLPTEAIKFIQNDYTIFKLSSNDTVFKQLQNEEVDCTRGFVIDYPDKVGVLDHFQSVIVINNASKTNKLVID